MSVVVGVGERAWVWMKVWVVLIYGCGYVGVSESVCGKVLLESSAILAHVTLQAQRMIPCTNTHTYTGSASACVPCLA